jgi:hypothetical protein
MTHENKNIGGRAEHPGSDEQKISQVLSTLKRVEAPKNFDFHLKARIANARPADYQKTSLFPILKYAMPLGLFLAVGAGMFLYSSYSTGLNTEMVGEPTGTSILNPAPVATTEPTVAQPNSFPPNDPSIVASASPEASGPQRNPDESRVASNPKMPSLGGSRDFRDFALPPPIGVPPNNSADKTVGVAPPPRTPKGMSSLNPMGLSDALRMIDAEAEFENNTWVVKSVKANGIADQMGLKAGDKLKAIDGKPIGEKTEFQRSFSAGTIQVQRGDAIVELGGAKKPN